MARPSRWDEVVASAAVVFRRRGFAHATLEEIADNLGMLKGSLYNYISTKEDLLTAVIALPAGRLLAATETIVNSDADSDSKLRGLIASHIDVIVDVYDFAAVYLHEIARPNLNDDWRKMDRTYVRLVESVVKEAVADGTLRADLNAHVATMTIIGACNWLTRWWDPTGPVRRDAVVAQLGDTLLLGLRAPQPARRTRSAAAAARKRWPPPVENEVLDAPPTRS